jgi:D-beta-D-heptose 7-phosphate kinase / D-beta-D-heptose 1-phosphate adenosyltransferase
VSADLIELVKRLGEPRVLVVGDVMLDRYIWGNAERISQEAPVPLFRADRREERLGGAGSVATMLAALGANVSLATVVGPDVEGMATKRILTERGIDIELIAVDPARPTTVKERYIGRAQQRHPQQMIRVDYEVRDALPGPIEVVLCKRIKERIADVDIVLISDYDKGVCTPSLLSEVIEQCGQRGIRVVADPIRGGDYRKYRSCSAITPNRLEAGLAAGMSIANAADGMRAATILRETLELEAAIVTLDRDGMAFASRNGDSQHFGTRPRQVYDITGAGDMVLSVLGISLAAGADYDVAIRLANVAGGLEVERLGVATLTRQELIDDLLRSPTSNKLCDVDELVYELDGRRRAGQRIAFTNGCFDILHAGHVQYLQEARAQGDLLVVGLNSDASVRSLKGPNRPVNDVESRAVVLGALQVVDYVVVFDAATPAQLIERVRPDVLVKGADYQREEVVGADFVESYGGRVHLAALRPGASTTDFIRKIKVA